MLTILAAAALAAVPGPPAAAANPSPAATPTATTTAPTTTRWRLVGEDDFTDPTLTPFRAYGGTPGCCRGTLWDTGQASVADGELRLRTSRNADGTWLSGGVGGYNWPAGIRMYGKWEARVRFDRGFGVWAALLLWPVSDSWPPEVDFYELFPTDADRTALVASSHYSAANRIDTASAPGDFASWHTVAVEWTAHRLAYLLDGRVWWQVGDPAAIPHEPMWLGIQTTLGSCPDSCPSAATPATVDLDVDWVRVYAPDGTVRVTPQPTPTPTPTPTPSPASTQASVSGQPTPSLSAPSPGVAAPAVASAVFVAVAGLVIAALLAARRRSTRHR